MINPDVVNAPVRKLTATYTIEGLNKLREVNGLNFTWKFFLRHPIRWFKKRGWRNREKKLVNDMAEEMRKEIDAEILKQTIEKGEL